MHTYICTHIDAHTYIQNNIHTHMLLYVLWGVWGVWESEWKKERK